MIMKKVTIVLLLLCGLLFASDGQKRKVAVYMSGEEPARAPGAHRVLGAELVKSIAASREYTVVDRTDAVLEAIDKEHLHQRSGAVSDDEIKELGRQFGVQYLSVGSVSEMRGGLLLEVRLVDVETAEVIKVASTRVNEFMGGDAGLMYAAQRVARTLVPGAGISSPRFYIDGQTGYYMSTGGSDITGVMGAVGATWFVNPQHLHRLGMSAGVSGIAAFGLGESDEYDYDLTVNSWNGFLSGIYRYGYKTRYVDASFSASLSLSSKVKITGYALVDEPDISDYSQWLKGDMELGYSLDVLGRYEYIGGGVGYVFSDSYMSIYLAGYIPVHKNIEVIPSLTIQVGDVTSLLMSLGARLSF